MCKIYLAVNGDLDITPPQDRVFSKHAFGNYATLSYCHTFCEILLFTLLHAMKNLSVALNRLTKCVLYVWIEDGSFSYYVSLHCGSCILLANVVMLSLNI